MIRLATLALAALALSATATAGAFSWTKPQTVQALKGAVIWKDTPPLAGTVSPLQISAVTAAKPVGRLVKGRTARWDVTVTLQNHVPATVISPLKTIPAHTVTTQERFCVTAAGPFKGRLSRFRIDGWAYNTLNGGCGHVGQFDSGGSASYRP